MIGSSGSRIGSLRRSSHSRRIGLDGAACCCAYARCDQIAAAPPRRVENSRRFIDSPPLTSGTAELLSPTVVQNGEAVANGGDPGQLLLKRRRLHQKSNSLLVVIRE